MRESRASTKPSTVHVVGEQGFVRRGADEQFGHAVVLREVLDGAPFHRGPVPGLEGYGMQPVAGGAGAGVDGFEGDGPGAGQDRVLELGQGLRWEVGAFAGDRRGAGQVDVAVVEGGEGGGQVGGDLVRVGQFRRELALRTEMDFAERKTSATGKILSLECCEFGLARVQVIRSIIAAAKSAFRGGFIE